MPDQPATSFTAAADQGVVVRVADDRVVVGAAQDGGDPHRVGKREVQRARDDGLGGGQAEVDRDPAGAWEKSSPATVAARGLGDRLAAARAAVEGEGVVATAAHQRVVARPASRVSGPLEPIKVSSPVPPWRMALPEKPEASSVKSPVPAARIACWNPLIVEAVAGRPPPESENVVSVSVMFCEP